MFEKYTSVKLVWIVFLLSSCPLFAQNTKIIASTSAGVTIMASPVKGLAKVGFTTATGLEYSLTKNFWLTGIIDFQSISYTRVLSNLEIKSKVNIIPLVIGGKYIFHSNSKFSPYLGINTGISLTNIPKGEIIREKVLVSSETKAPLTYLLSMV